jgi:hypothetical protein
MDNEAQSYTITDEASRKNIARRLAWLLDLLDKEHHHCNTHSQRNMYQAVIRHEVEVLISDLARTPYEDLNDQVSDIPF